MILHLVLFFKLRCLWWDTVAFLAGFGIVSPLWLFECDIRGHIPRIDDLTTRSPRLTLRCVRTVVHSTVHTTCVSTVAFTRVVSSSTFSLRRRVARLVLRPSASSYAAQRRKLQWLRSKPFLQPRKGLCGFWAEASLCCGTLKGSRS